MYENIVNGITPPKIKSISGNEQIDGLFYLLHERFIEQHPNEDLIKVKYRFHKLFLISIIALGLGVFGSTLGLGLYLDLQKGSPHIILDDILAYSICGAGVTFLLFGIILILTRFFLRNAIRKFIHSIREDIWKEISNILYKKCEESIMNEFMILEKKFSFNFNNKIYNCKISYKNDEMQNEINFYNSNDNSLEIVHYANNQIRHPLCSTAIEEVQNKPFTFDMKLKKDLKPSNIIKLFIPKFNSIDISVKLDGIKTIEELKARSRELFEQTDKAIL